MSLKITNKAIFFDFKQLNFSNKRFFNISSKLHETPLKFKNVPVYSFVNNNKKNETKSKERLYVWGYAALGALGEPQFLRPLKENQNRIYKMRKPWRLRWVDRINADLTNVACGNGFSLISISNSKTLRGHNLFGTGMNTQSQIGVHEASNGDIFKYIIEPALIELPLEKEERENLKIIDISCGRSHSLVLTNFGLFTFGNNAYGQCARPIIENEEYFGNRSVVQNVSKFIELDPGDQIISVKAGQDHSCFLTKNGQVYTCGWSADGQLGQDIYTVGAIPKKIKGDLEGVFIKQIATKGDFVLALSECGEIFGWGNNEYKQITMCGSNEPQIGVPKHLKLPSYVKIPVRKVAAAGTKCLIIDADYNIWIWGYGLLGKGPKCDESVMPTMIPPTLFGKYQEIEHTLKKKAISVDCGLFSSSVTFDDGTLYMWGKNKYGNLGTGDDMDAFMPFRVNIPARVKKVDLGADQTFAICKTNL